MKCKTPDCKGSILVNALMVFGIDRESGDTENVKVNVEHAICIGCHSVINRDDITQATEAAIRMVSESKPKKKAKGA